MRLDVRADDPGERQTVTVAADRWGRYPIRATVDVVAPGGLLSGTATVDAADVFVFPLAPPQSTAIPKTELLDRLGTHLTRHIGPGVEYADIRPYVPGDQLRTVNWPVSARRGSLHVTQRLTDRAADVVVLIDMYAAAAGSGDGSDRTSAARRRSGGAERAAKRRSRRGRHARRRSTPLARRRHRPAAVLPGARHAARGGRRIRNHHRHIGAPRRPSAGCDRRRILDDARHRVRAVVDRPAQARPHRRRRRRSRRRTVSEERYTTRCSPGCGRCSGRSCTATWAPSEWTWCPGRRRAPSTSRCGWFPSVGGRCGGGDDAHCSAEAHLLSTAFGLVMVAAAGFQTAGPALVRRDARRGRGVGGHRVSRRGDGWRFCWPPRRSWSPMRRRCWPHSPACPRRATWCCGTPRADSTGVIGASAPAMLAALGFTFVGVLAASFPFELPWLPSARSAGGVRDLRARHPPVLPGGRGQAGAQFQILTRRCGSR